MTSRKQTPLSSMPSSSCRCVLFLTQDVASYMVVAWEVDLFLVQAMVDQILCVLWFGLL